MTFTKGTARCLWLMARRRPRRRRTPRDTRRSAREAWRPLAAPVNVPLAGRHPAERCIAESLTMHSLTLSAAAGTCTSIVTLSAAHRGLVDDGRVLLSGDDPCHAASRRGEGG